MHVCVHDIDKCIDIILSDMIAFIISPYKRSLKLHFKIYLWKCLHVSNSCCHHTSNGEPPDIIEDNCCMCNTAALYKMAPADDLDLVYVTYHVDVAETPFFVALDHSRKAVVISIRGTLSMKVGKFYNVLFIC